MDEEQSPVHADDQRLRTRLHELRAKAWISRVMVVSGLKTPYKLNEKFGGGQRKWKGYQNGHMPNAMTVRTVELAFPGTQDWFERGPSDLALWPALGHKNIDVLRTIVKRSSRIDSEIAKLRLDAAMDLIEVEYPPPPKFDSEGKMVLDFRWPPVWFDEEDMAGDDYVVSQQVVLYGLEELDILSSALCDEIADYLYALLQPYRINAYRTRFEEFYDSIMDTRLTFAAGQKAYEEHLYATACMKNIGNKGRRSDVE